MSGSAAQEDAIHLMRILRESMQDPSLSGGCPILGELFAAIAEDEEARPLLEEIPAWKMPGLILSAALLFRAFSNANHPLAHYLTNFEIPDTAEFRAAVRHSLVEEKQELSVLVSRHTYQCNPPRRMAVSLLLAATVAGDWEPALHVDVGTASGIGLLLGKVRVNAGGASLGPQDARLEYSVDLRGAPFDVASLKCPRIERSVGIDLDPPDLRDADCRAWMRACQFPNAAELAFFDAAVDLLLAGNPRIERGSAIDLLPEMTAGMRPRQPLIVTDTYVTLFMSEEDRERMRRQLDAIAQSRPVVWISNNALVPVGQAPDSTTAGTAIPEELMERNQRELFGALSITTWQEGKRTPRLVGVNAPGASWMEWRRGAAPT